MHAAVVLNGFNVVIHMCRLRILPQYGIVIGSSRGLHRADAHPVDVTGKQPLTDDPVRLVGGFLSLILFDERAVHI